jgi:cell division inhibitor SulA
LIMNTARQLHHVNAWERTSAIPASRITTSGIPALDGLLPGGGWPKVGLVELVVPDAQTDAMPLLLPALARISQQGRWITMVNPPHQARLQLCTAAEVNAARILQVNPHPGRSALWTMESMLRSRDCGVVMAWPPCYTELMGKRLQKAAALGRALGILCRQERQVTPVPGVDLRLRLEDNPAGTVVYRLNGQGVALSGAVLIR